VHQSGVVKTIADKRIPLGVIGADKIYSENSAIRKSTDENLERLKKKLPRSLPAEEWDFRAIKEEMLYGAIYYEYARSSGWVQEAFAKWHEQRIALPKNSEDFVAWNAKKVADVLNYSARNDLPGDVSMALHESMPKAFHEDPLDNIFWIAGFQFPTPFLQLPSIDPKTFQFLNRHYDTKRPAFAELVPREELFRGLLYQHEHSQNKTLGGRLVVAQVDLSAGKTKVVADFKKWVDTLPRLKNRQGKASSLPWHHLKELAAYRLFKIAKLTYPEAKEEVRKRHLCCKIKSYADVLPAYHASGFSDAVSSAERRILQLYPLQEG
jgi:hypothetical protein